MMARHFRAYQIFDLTRARSKVIWGYMAPTRIILYSVISGTEHLLRTTTHHVSAWDIVAETVSASQALIRFWPGHCPHIGRKAKSGWELPRQKNTINRCRNIADRTLIEEGEETKIDKLTNTLDSLNEFENFLVDLGLEDDHEHS